MEYSDTNINSRNILCEFVGRREQLPAVFVKENVTLAPAIDVYTAANIGDYEAVYQALNCSNIKIVKKNSSGWSPLMYACYNDHNRIVELLISCGVDKYDRNTVGHTPLMLAALNGNEKLLELVYEDYMINLRDQRGWSALFHAVSRRRENAVKFLLKRGADVNIIACDNGYTVLMVAAAAGKINVVKMLLEAGANPYKMSWKGGTAISIAQSHGFFHIVQLLSANTESCVSEKPLLDLESLFISLDLKDYWPLFQRKNISIEQFFLLTEENLKEIGVCRLGPRKKLALAIFKWRHRQQNHQHRSSHARMCPTYHKQYK